MIIVGQTSFWNTFGTDFSYLKELVITIFI